MNPRLLPSLSLLPSCRHHEPPVRAAGCGGTLLKPAQATINVATAYVPAGAPSELLHPGARLVLNPRSGVLDTVSRSHLARSRVTARLKSRLALALGLVFLVRFPSRLERPARKGGMYENKQFNTIQFTCDEQKRERAEVQVNLQVLSTRVS